MRPVLVTLALLAGGCAYGPEIAVLPESIDYRCADGKPFARKRVVAATSPAMPEFALEDARDGYREGVRGGGGKRSVFVRAPGRQESSRPLSPPADGVIDALNYDKYTHDKSSECICVLGGL